jgi:hypothetical protein
MMATLATSKNPEKEPWAQHVNGVKGSQKAMLEDTFNLEPRVWGKGFVNM